MSVKSPCTRARSPSLWCKCTLKRKNYLPLQYLPHGKVPVARRRLKSRQSIRGNEMRWTFVCLTGNIQPVSFSVSETAVSASEHYCQANVWWKHTDFPSSCQPHGSFSQTVCSALGAGLLNLRWLGGAAQLSQIRASGLFFTSFVSSLIVSRRRKLLAAKSNCLESLGSIFFCYFIIFFLLPVFILNATFVCSELCAGSPWQTAQHDATLCLGHSGVRGGQNISRHT